MLASSGSNIAQMFARWPIIDPQQRFQLAPGQLAWLYPSIRPNSGLAYDNAVLNNKDAGQEDSTNARNLASAADKSASARLRDVMSVPLAQIPINLPLRS